MRIGMELLLQFPYFIISKQYNFSIPLKSKPIPFPIEPPFDSPQIIPVYEH